MKKRYLAMFMAITVAVSSFTMNGTMQTVMAAEVPAVTEGTEAEVEAVETTDEMEEESAETDVEAEDREETIKAENEERIETENAEEVKEEEESEAEGEKLAAEEENTVDSKEEKTAAELELLSDKEETEREATEEVAGEKDSEEIATEAENIKTQSEEAEKGEDLAEEPADGEEAAEKKDSEEITAEAESVDAALEENTRNIVYEGKSNEISWSIDTDGLLLVEGSGDFESDDYYGSKISPWYVYKEYIQSAKVIVTGMTDASSMFYGCGNLSSVDISNFDTSQVTNMGHMFHGCGNLSSVDVSKFDTSQVTDMGFMFYGCYNLSSVDVSKFDTSQVTNMFYMFAYCENLSSVDVSGFDTSQVTNMGYMFSGCSNLSSVDVSKFDTSQVTDMGHMFSGCSNLSSVDVSKFDTSQVTDMSSMFAYCENLSSVDVSKFDTSQVTNMFYMFKSCYNLSSVDVSNFDTSQVTNMGSMFNGCGSLNDLDVSGFDTSKVTDMSHMFEWCGINSLDVSNFDTSKVTDMSVMFSDCDELNSLNLSNFDTSKVTNMDMMFYGSSELNSVDVSSFNTSNVTDMSEMFWRCGRLESLDVSGFDTSNVTSMNQMFHGCSKLESLDVSGFDTSQVTDMSGMFWECNGLNSLDVSGFDTSKVTSMSRMFSNCVGLNSLDVSGFDTSKVTSMSGMFNACRGLNNVEVSNFDTSKVTNMSEMFAWCRSLENVNVSNFDTLNVTNMYEMFDECNALSRLDLSSFELNNLQREDYMWSSYMFDNCGLKEIDSPRNLSVKIELPDIFESEDGTQYTALPLNAKESIHLSVQKTAQYSISFNGNGATSGVMSAQQMTYGSGEMLSASTFKRTGYTFTGWNTKADGTGTSYADKSDGSKLTEENNAAVTLYAQWKKVKYSITYQLNGGTNSTGNPASYDVTTAAITLKNPTRTGYTFSGWYTDTALTKKITTVAKGSTGNKTLYAGWKPNTYTITYKGNGNTSGSMTSTSCKYGSSYVLKANAFKKTGYSFAGWNTKADGTGTTYKDKASVKNLTSKAGGTLNLYAKWTKVKYTITYHLNDGKNSSGNPVSYYVTSSSITLKNPTRTGYTFAGWYKDSAYKTKVTKITQGSTGNRALYAKWTPNKYNIVYKGNGSTSGSMTASKDCKYGSNYALKANTFKKTGYSFAGWNTKADGTGTTYKNKASVKNLTSKAGGTINLYAKWSKVKYTITYKLNGGKNSSANPSSYYITTSTITLKNPTRTGYKFMGWYKDSAYKSKVTKITKGSYGNRTLYAKWTPNKYNIVYKGNGNTSGSMTSTACRYGYDYTLKANAFKKKGYTFVEWNTKADGSGKTYKNKTAVRNLTSKSGATITLYARWKKTKYSITYKLNGGKNSTGNPSYYYMTSSGITLKNPVRTGYTFAGWYKESTYKTKVTRIATGSTGNRTLYAKWKKK